jgi:hypothetical protein
MPVCRECGKTQPSCEVRRAPRGPVCKDKQACLRRQARTRQTLIEEGMEQ